MGCMPCSRICRNGIGLPDCRKNMPGKPGISAFSDDRRSGLEQAIFSVIQGVLRSEIY
jgi:hypothetical protein